ncbi:hypothetical protein HS048_23410 [Planomonospora sp. ID91781]|uniref:hypothetical protein n=1 Tax=Planomonospora sp. ID91781 TaxID=2738135 RepID=UPI0018C40EB0|nr:hypothetical protein [Planomonospora sp. ID91781]MBG0823672.1 hypothetical protein [Planomonospora sp. ID91781]
MTGASTRSGTGDPVRSLRTAWTGFRRARGRVAATAAGALAVVLLGLASAAGSHTSCSAGAVEVACPALPVGPGGEAVEDEFFFVHRALTGDGGITARVTSLTGVIRKPDAVPGVRNVVAGVVPWAKAGVMVKESTEQGSSYAAVMVTGAHGVRMQHDFTHDVAGRPGGVSEESPRWLRLVRSGDTLIGYESADGAHWSEVGTARLPGLQATVEIGLFAASPGDLTVTPGALGGSASRFSEATAAFDRVTLEGGTAGGEWREDDVGVTREPGGSPHHPGRASESGGAFSVTGNGDIAPSTAGQTLERTLVGLPAGLIAVIVVAVMSATAEYRYGLGRTAPLARPRRGRMPAAGAAVIAAVAFAAGLAATAVTLTAGSRILRANGNQVLPVSWLTEVRVVVGTAALFAVAAVLSFALGVLFRHGAGAIPAAVALIVLPHLLATVSVLPDSAAQWLLRVTPAAGFAIQQSIPQYTHVLGHYAPSAGFYPLAPWAGLGVLAAWAAVALLGCGWLLRRRDA